MQILSGVVYIEHRVVVMIYREIAIVPGNECIGDVRLYHETAMGWMASLQKQETPRSPMD